jgi:2-hydroxychromene-2-carboxylate isomerase
MKPLVDLFWSFRSPYSYLATPGALEIPVKFAVSLRFRPVLPLAVRQPDFFSPENFKRAKYILVDWPRRAEMLGLPHAWPSPDPIIQDLETFKVAEPGSHREEVSENQHALEQSGQWGVPTFVFNGEPFFGQDRIETLCWRLRKENLALS